MSRTILSAPKTLDFESGKYFKQYLRAIYTIQDFGLLWHIKINPNLEKISKDAYGWAADRLRLAQNEKYLLKQDGTATCAALVYPHLNEFGLLQAAK